ncbi:MAG: manganese efflux pump [Phycisphaerae bacterium]|nr:manganese efflux pump [Phycisphaerae bacterium]
MSVLTLILIAIGLAVDAFAVSIAVSSALGSVSPRQVFRLAFHLGLFQALMPVLGWLAGRRVGELIAEWDHWVAFGLLAFVGGKAVYEALSRQTWPVPRSDPTRGLTLVLLSLATSIDALAVGMSLAFLRVEIWYPSALIGCVAAALTVVGMLLGSRLGSRFGRHAEVFGGVILIGLGLKILIEGLV